MIARGYEIQLTQSGIRHGYLRFAKVDPGFFPADSFGKRNKRQGLGKPLRVYVRGYLTPIFTDIPAEPGGNPRWFFRNRSWMADFVRANSLKLGDRVNIVRLSEREYRIEPVPRVITFIDLFAGIGGTRLGFEAAGAKCVFTSEWDKFCQETYSANFGETPEGDITEIDSSRIPDHDVLVAGFPCQPFSIAGVSKKNALGRPHGFEDETQGTLFFQIARILKERQPRAFLLENVRNLRSHDQGRTYQVIMGTLRDLGYHVADKIIHGSLVVPQHRERVFIVGTKPALAFDFPADSDFQAKRRAARIGDILEPHVPAKYTLTDHLWSYLRAYAEKHRQAGNGFGFGLVKPGDITRTLSARYYKDGSEILVFQLGRNPRRLTPRECARLMGFPDSFKIPVSDTQAYKQFGNSVIVPIIEVIARVLVRCIQQNRLSIPAKSEAKFKLVSRRSESG